MWHLVLLGPPGSGKSTQADLLSAEWNLAHLSTGEMLRDEVARRTPLGREADRHMSQGQLVPPELVNRLMRQTLGALRARGWVLDGYPRSIAQADALDALLTDMDLGLDAVIVIQVAAETAVARLAARLICQSCGATYNVDDVAGADAECRVCGGPLVRRDDDAPEVVRARFTVYQTEMLPVLERYRRRGELVEVDGSGTRDAVYARLTRALLARRQAAT